MDAESRMRGITLNRYTNIHGLQVLLDMARLTGLQNSVMSGLQMYTGRVLYLWSEVLEILILETTLIKMVFQPDTTVFSLMVL